jgi:hypothetical protein
MPNHAPKETISGRVTPEVKEKLRIIRKKKGYTVGDIVSYRINDFLDPVISKEVDLKFANDRLTESKMDIISEEMNVESLTQELDELKKRDPDRYPEIRLQALADEFLDKYNSSPYFHDVELDDALEMARKGLSRHCRDIGYSFEELVDEVKMMSSKSFTNDVYVSAKNI